MVIDTSAIAQNEPEAPTLEQRIADDPVRFISAATLLEAAMVLETRFGEPGGAEIYGLREPTSKSLPLRLSMPIRRGAPGAATARAGIRPA